MAREANQAKRKKRDGRSCTRRVDGVRALRLHQDRGVALIAAVLFLVGLTTLGLVGIEMASNELQDTARMVSRSQALYQADAGAEEARMRFYSAVGTDYLGTGGAGLTMETVGPYTTDWRACVGSSTSPDAAALGCTVTTTTPSLQTDVPFSIAAIQHATWSGVIQCYDPDAGTPLYNATAGACNLRHVPAEQITAMASSMNITRTVVARFVPKYRTPFQYGLNANEKVKLSGDSCIDSYNSNSGFYPGIPEDCTGAGNQGSVAVNSTAKDKISISTGDINGDVTVGVGGDPDKVVNKPSQVNGDINVASEPLEYPQVTVPSGLPCSPLKVVGGGDVPIGPGVFCYTKLELIGGSTLTTAGKVTIYITDTLKVTGGGFVNTGGDPTDLLIVVTSNKKVDYSGSNDFYGSIYAPDSNVEVTGGGQFYGAAVGKEIKFSGGSSAHFDLALMSKTIDVLDGYRLFTWRAI